MVDMTQLEIAKKILEVNTNASLTGTLMLELRGIDLDRKPKDIDILICDYAPRLIISEGMDFEELGSASDGSGIKYRYEGFIIDVISDGEEPEVIDGIRLGTVERLLSEKYRYGKQDHPDKNKHREDICKILKQISIS